MSSKLMVTAFLVSVCLMAGLHEAEANAIRVATNANDTLTFQGSAAFIEFDIAWNNSWRVSNVAPTNWDAAWIFVKYKPASSTVWHHATLATGGHTAPTGCTIDTPSDGMGVFLYRASDGIGDVSFPGVKLRWNLAADGVTLHEGDNMDISVHAIEMVYIPEGTFSVGDGRANNIQGTFEAGNTGNPFSIGSEGALTLGGTAGGNLSNNDNLDENFSWNDDDFDYATTTNLPASFPKGHQAFYCEKYESSQGQYTAFLNKLTSAQASMHAPTADGGFGQSIGWSGTAYTSGVPDRACNFIAYTNAAAYADWAALRPMTELEFEKVCRGPLTPVALEYAWGSTDINVSFRYTYSNEGQSNETVNAVSGTGNLLTRDTDPNYNGGDNGRPCRCGIFAASFANPTREEAGATYYGVMNMAGNLGERLVVVGHAQGRAFQGTHGNGELTSTGYADVSDWPGYSGGKVVSWEGGGRRGGNLTAGPTVTPPVWIATVSDRTMRQAELTGGGSNVFMNRSRDHGCCRHVRTAPTP